MSNLNEMSRSVIQSRLKECDTLKEELESMKVRFDAVENAKNSYQKLCKELGEENEGLKDRLAKAMEFAEEFCEHGRNCIYDCECGLDKALAEIRKEK